MRAQVVLLEGHRILLARHRRKERDYWVLPGGEIEEGETPEDAAVREVREETGLEVRLARLLFVDEPREDGEVVIRSPRHTFLGEIVCGELATAPDVDVGGEKGYLVGVEWMEFDSPRLDAATRDTLTRVVDALDLHRT